MFENDLESRNQAWWNGFKVGWDQRFQRDGTVQLFGTKGQKFHHCPGTKGQRDSQNLGWNWPGKPKSGMGHRTKRDRAEKDVLKQEK